ncbi:MAG: YbaN family protein [Bacteroidales bacterium]
MHTKIRQILFLSLGTLSLVLGIIGMALPILPTTPFLLLTAFLYMHSSQKWYDRLLANKYTGPVIEDYKIHKSIALRKKVVILSLLWSTMIINIIWFVDNIWIDLLLLAIALGVTIHILRIRTRR